ncbi:MAG TPA: hypothetical protein VMJ64_09080 [Anaerolineales bacterium]|nr:hypothetical protein [Anaerolineales bacterium]
MSEDQEVKDLKSMLSDEYTMAWMQEHLPDLKQSISGQRLLYQSLVLGLVVGLIAHVAGYVLLLYVPPGPLGLLADLLHALGWSLWTGVVVAVFIQIIPDVKRRQIKEAVEAYEALRREKAGDGSPGGEDG